MSRMSMARESIAAFWERVTEPRHIKVVYVWVYTVAMLTGLATLLYPPQSIEGVLGRALMVAWSTLFLVGGFGGMVTILPGWWKWERWSISAVLMGIAIYGAVLLSLHFTQQGSRLTQMGVLLLASAVFVVKWMLIRFYSFEPRR